MTVDSRPLEGKVALVTGASRGIGRVAALSLARRGARVAVVARTQVPRSDLPGTVDDTAAQIRQEGGAATAVVADLLEPGSVARAHAEVVQALGPVDILVNNAANTGAPVFESIWDQTPQAWRAHVELNVNVPREFIGLVAPSMRERGHGVVINVSSSAGLDPEGPIPQLTEPGGVGTAYPTTKAALNQMTRYLANELVGFGITVVALEPGFTRTEATELHAAAFGIDLSLAHPMELVGDAIVEIAACDKPGTYSGRFVYATDVVGVEREANVLHTAASGD
ncbi:MAG TPA: SDR family NAD(P)-dependent oxidoreductase [Mycobacteriales bacterium]|nr:SDR family NAD(P)-dependent oxidoreductase [Mycobacteriales bacterium]